MLPHVRGRPVTMERYPRGIAAKGFIQKDVSKGFPDWLERVEVPKKDGTVHHPLVSDTRSLLWVTNQNCITPHVWTLPDTEFVSARPVHLRPRSGRRGLSEVLRAATLALRDLLDELGLPSWVKTSGSKGFHIVVPLDGKTGFGEVAAFAHAVGAVMVKRDPAAPHAGVPQGGSCRSHPRRHGSKRLRRDLCRPLRGSRPHGCAGLGAVHVGRS